MELLNGFIATDKEKIKMAQTFNANKLQILTKIVIPSNIPTFFNTLKVNIGLTLVGVISGEFLVSKGGLGYLIVYGGQVFQLDLVMTSVIILAFLAALMYESRHEKNNYVYFYSYYNCSISVFSRIIKRKR